MEGIYWAYMLKTISNSSAIQASLLFSEESLKSDLVECYFI